MSATDGRDFRETKGQTRSVSQRDPIGERERGASNRETDRETIQRTRFELHEHRPIGGGALWENEHLKNTTHNLIITHTHTPTLADTVIK